MTRLAPGALLALTLLGGCGGEPARQADEAGAVQAMPGRDAAGAPPVVAPAPAPEAAAVALAVDGEGLRLFDRATGAASPIPFGQAQDAVMARLTALRGAPSLGTSESCGAGPVQVASWPDGLSLVFQAGRLTGWGLDRRASGAFGTAAGVGPGSTRAEMAEAYADVAVAATSLGDEFSAGGFAGVLDGSGMDARVTDMWAGMSCVAR